MLQQLTIRNFAIIDDLTVEFRAGFSTMTGETGAGKSIIIEALGLLLGERANASMVRTGATKAFIEGVFQLPPPQRERVVELVGSVDDELFIIRRDVDVDGKSSIRLNGRLSTNAIIRTIMKSIVDIHSQHDNLYLADEKNHLGLLDTFAHDTIQPTLQSYQSLFQAYSVASHDLAEAEKTHYTSDQLEFFTFQKQEIEAANVRIGELDELGTEKKRISQYETIARQVTTTLAFLKDDQGSLPTLYQAQKALGQLHSDAQFEAYSEQLADLYHQLVAISDGIEADFEKLQLDEQRIQEINDRLYLYSKLKRKYGSNEREILDFYDQVTRQIELASQHELVVSRLAQQKAGIEAQLRQKGSELSQLRQQSAKHLEQAIISELRDLFLPRAIFKVVFQHASSPFKDGLDVVEFHVSVNPGQAPQSIAKVASGGEISRLMLALKVIFNRLYGVATTIFDEVDTGVSGEIARAIGQKMRMLAQTGQVIAITHLPQVAAASPVQIHVTKKMAENTTSTLVHELDLSERIEVIAKMLSGASITPAARLNAEQLLHDTHE